MTQIQTVFARREPAQEAALFDKMTDTKSWYDVVIYRDAQCKATNSARRNSPRSLTTAS